MSLALIAARGTHDRPGGWTPDDLATLDLWLDADDATTITIATGVSQWDDKSGNARHVSQSNGANQPALVANGQNGRAVLRFDGATSWLRAGDALDLGTSGLSVAAVYAPNAATATGRIVTKARNSSITTTAGTWQAREEAIILRQPTLRSQNLTAASGIQLVVWAINRSSGVAVSRNGATPSLAATGFPDTTTYNNAITLTVGAFENTGSTDATGILDGDIAEVVLSLATWTTDERQKVEGYLAHKWGLASSLPTGHPYRSVAP